MVTDVQFIELLSLGRPLVLGAIHLFDNHSKLYTNAHCLISSFCLSYRTGFLGRFFSGTFNDLLTLKLKYSGFNLLTFFRESSC